MSKKGVRTKKGGLEVKGFAELEEVVNSAVAQLKELRTQIDRTQKEGGEMKELLRKFTEGEEDPALLIARLRDLESENQEFLNRLKRGKEGVERLLARIRFLEEQG